MKYKISSMGGDSNNNHLVATQNIRAGELVIQERPLVTVLDNVNEQDWIFPWRLTEAILANSEIKKQYWSWKLKITTPVYFSFMLDHEERLAKKYDMTTSAIRLLYFSVTTNNIGFPALNGNVAGWGLYKHICRVNHSCDPNTILMAMSHKDVVNKVISLVALRDIAVGESITWSYLGMGSEFIAADHKTRGQALFDRFFFACSCERCQVEIPVELTDSKVRHKQYWQALKDSLDPFNPTSQQ